MLKNYKKNNIVGLKKVLRKIKKIRFIKKLITKIINRKNINLDKIKKIKRIEDLH
jgi:hypothetical protein